jgi:hypothetical protein
MYPSSSACLQAPSLLRTAVFFPTCGGLTRRYRQSQPVEFSEWQERADCAERHEQAREWHAAAAVRHDAAALRWSEVGMLRVPILSTVMRGLSETSQRLRATAHSSTAVH